jgi:hypothetical protein
MGGRADSSCPVNVDTDVALFAQKRLTGVNADADPKRSVGQCGLYRRGGIDRIARLGEGVEESIALRIDLDSAVPPEGLSDDPAMLGQGLRVPIAELAEEAGRALDVGEDKGHGAGWKSRRTHGG